MRALPQKKELSCCLEQGVLSQMWSFGKRSLVGDWRTWSSLEGPALPKRLRHPLVMMGKEHLVRAEGEKTKPRARWADGVGANRCGHVSP